jgi:sulfur carrier protein
MPDTSRLEITVNGVPRAVSPGSTVASLLQELEMTARHVAVEVNLELIPRTRHAEHLLQDGDELEVVTLVGGG